MDEFKSVSTPQEEENNENEEEIVNVEEVSKEITEKLRAGLSKIERVGNKGDFGYVTLECREKELTNLYNTLDQFQHIRYLDLSKNLLKDVSGLRALYNIVILNISENEIENACIFEDPNIEFFSLRKLNMSKNKLKSFRSLNTPNITSLNLNNNEIEYMDVSNITQLEDLELRGNKLKDIDNIKQLKKVKKIYAAENYFDDITLFKNLYELRQLHLRTNFISSLNTLCEDDFENLEYLNLRDNKIANLNELKSIVKLKNLKKISFLDNIVCENASNIINSFVETFLTDRNGNRLENIASKFLVLNKVHLDDNFYLQLKEDIHARDETTQQSKEEEEMQIE